MKLDDLEYEVLIIKYYSLDYDEKKIYERLKMIDPYISLDALKLILPLPLQ